MFDHENFTNTFDTNHKLSIIKAFGDRTGNFNGKQSSANE